MRYAIDFMGQRYEASPEIKVKELLCPQCKGEVIAKTGQIKAYHFAHKEKDCGYFKYKGMSEWHTNWQNLFKEHQREVRITKEGKTHIADVRNSNGVVIEFQHSSITAEEKGKRDIFYNKLIWVVDVSDVLQNITIIDKPIPTVEYRKFGRQTMEEEREKEELLNYLLLSRSAFLKHIPNDVKARITLVDITSKIMDGIKNKAKQSFKGEKFIRNTFRFNWKWPRKVWFDDPLCVPVFLDLGGSCLYQIIDEDMCSPFRKEDFIKKYCV